MDIKITFNSLILLLAFAFLLSCNKGFRKADTVKNNLSSECHSESLKSELDAIVNNDQNIRAKITLEAQKSNGQGKLLKELKLESLRIDSISGIRIKELIEECPAIYSQSRFASTLWLVAQHCGHVKERRVYYQPKLKELYSTERLRKDHYLMFLDRTYTIMLFQKNKDIPPWPSMSEVELIKYFEKAMDTESKL